MHYYELYKVILIPYFIGVSTCFEKKKSYKFQHDSKVPKMINTIEKL